MSRPFTQSDLETFWVSLARRICSGQNLITSLSDIRDDLGNSALAEVVGDLMNRISAGSTLASAMSAHPEAFGAPVVSLVQGGEYGGFLHRTLMLILEHTWRCPDCILGSDS